MVYPPGGDPNVTEDERRTITEMMAKGTFAMLMLMLMLMLASADVDAAFSTVQAAGAEVMQEPTDQDWGMRDCAFRDPAGNTVRIQQV